MRIFYLLSSYISHQNAGLEYIKCLQELGHDVSINAEDNCNLQSYLSEKGSLAFCQNPDLLKKAQEADLIIIHEHAPWISDIFKALPFLKNKRTIAYFPWENEQLQNNLIEPLSLVSEIWTCSQFSQQAIGKHFSNCHLVPHVVKRKIPSNNDLTWARESLEIHKASNSFTLFSIIDATNPRKNLTGLLKAFNLAEQQSKAALTLVLKQYRQNVNLTGLKNVISIDTKLSEGQISALHLTTDAYISMHHAEGWGLGLSDSMSFAKPTIATAYSGNLDFMNTSNSYLIPYKVTNISDAMCKSVDLFNTAMHWAEPSITHAAKIIAKLADNATNKELCLNAASICKSFSTKQVAEIISNLL